VKLEERSNRLRCHYGNQSLILAGERQARGYCSSSNRTLDRDLLAHELVKVEIRQCRAQLRKVVRLRTKPVLSCRFHLQLCQMCHRISGSRLLLCLFKRDAVRNSGSGRGRNT